MQHGHLPGFVEFEQGLRFRMQTEIQIGAEAVGKRQPRPLAGIEHAQIGRAGVDVGALVGRPDQVQAIAATALKDHHQQGLTRCVGGEGEAPDAGRRQKDTGGSAGLEKIASARHRQAL